MMLLSSAATDLIKLECNKQRSDGKTTKLKCASMDWPGNENANKRCGKAHLTTVAKWIEPLKHNYLRLMS